MKQLLRTTLLTCLFLSISGNASAQHFVAQPPSAPGNSFHGSANSTPIWPSSSLGSVSWANSSFGDRYGFARHSRRSSRHSGLRSPASISDGPIGYVHGDAGFVPSRYMDYQEALKLGNVMLNKPQDPPQPSLGDIARSLRAGNQTQANPGAIVAFQNNTGELVICHRDCTEQH
jgi:hypothetical protein